jgi:hypothetical protein
MPYGEGNAPEVVGVNDAAGGGKAIEEMAQAFVTDTERLTQLRTGHGGAVESGDELFFEVGLVGERGRGSLDNLEVGVVLIVGVDQRERERVWGCCGAVFCDQGDEIAATAQVQ